MNTPCVRILLYRCSFFLTEQSDVRKGVRIRIQGWIHLSWPVTDGTKNKDCGLPFLGMVMPDCPQNAFIIVVWSGCRPVWYQHTRSTYTLILYNKEWASHRIAHRTHQCSGNGENGTMCQWSAKGWWTVNDNGSCLMVILIDTAHRDNTSQDDYMFFIPCRMFHPPLHYYMYYREIFPKINLYSANTTITVLHH